MGQQALYRFYDDAGQLLYVGITNDPGRRMSQHAEQKRWWPEVRGVSIEWYDDREGVAAAERRAVAIERPRHNKQLRQMIKLPESRRGDQPTDVLVWSCDECGLPVEPADGYLHVSMKATLQHGRAEEDFRKICMQQGTWTSYSMADYMDLVPDPAPWLAHHSRCDPEPDSADHWIAIDQIDSYRKLLARAIHLGQKRWINDTNWWDLLEQIVARDH